MNILGEGFHPTITNQIKVRQKTLASGFNSNNPRTPAFVNYINASTSFVRLMSSVNIENSAELNNPYIGTLNLTGAELAKKAILFAGVTELGGSLKGGIPKIKPSTASVFNNYSYGWGTDSNSFGLRPMPGITSANIKSENIGSLKTATINIKCWDKSQFEIIDTLYLRLGFYVLLEWGHTIYLDNKGTPQTTPKSLQNEFFSNSPNVDTLLGQIVNARYDSNGNYDAILGKVVNFNWNFNSDGSYNIVLTVRSVGDIIESLKVNLLTSDTKTIATKLLTPEEVSKGSINVTGANYSPSSIINENNKSNIHALLYTLKNIIDFAASENKNINSVSVTTSLSNNRLQDILRQTWSGATEENPSYYIRLGALLKIIEQSIIPTIEQGNSSYKILNIDYNPETNIINCLDSQLSTDPSKVLVQKNIAVGKDNVQIIPTASPFEVSIKGETYGKLMNVYINSKFIKDKLDDLITAPSSKIALIDFFKALGQTIGSCLGSINNIVPVIDEDTNTLRFIDQNKLYKKDEVITYFNDKINEAKKIPLGVANKETLAKFEDYKGFNNINDEPAVFDLYGYNPLRSEGSGSAGFIKDFTMKTELTPQFASMITIGAAARQRVVGEDATALSRLNKGLNSRLIEFIGDPYLESSSSLNDQYKTTVTDYSTFVNSMNMSNNALPVWDKNSFDTYGSVLNTFITYVQQLMFEQTGSATTSTGFIPINISLTMAGLSGMKIYQEFTVDTNYLPSNYSREMTFVIKGVNHTIENNMWNTTIDSLSLPKITNKPSKFTLSDALNKAGGSTTNEGNPIPDSYETIVKQIIKAANDSGITDKSQLTAILTVAQAETSLNPLAIEGNKLYTLARAKEVFISRLKGKTDVEIRNIFSTPESTYNFVYANKNGNGPNEGYKYRGRGFSQITGKGNYIAMNRLLAKKLSRTFNPTSYDIVTDPDLATTEYISILILILGKINGTFGNKLNEKIDYTINPVEIVNTQNRDASQAIIDDYSRALNSINRTKWIQDLLNKK